MPEEKKKTRKPILTRKEQALLAFILALLIVGGIVRKVRTEWSQPHEAQVHQTAN